MENFLPINKSKLKNTVHFEFFSSFITVLENSGLVAGKIATVKEHFAEVFNEEERCLRLARASELVARRKAADARRDNFYIRLNRLVKAWRGSGEESLDAAAETVGRLFAQYKLNVAAQLDSETGLMSRMIQELETQPLHDAIVTLGAEYLFAQMKEAHEEVKVLRLQEGEQQSERQAGALVAARKQSDLVYDELVSLIEAFALTADNPEPYEQFIRQWNGMVRLYKETLTSRKPAVADSVNPEM